MTDATDPREELVPLELRRERIMDEAGMVELDALLGYLIELATAAREGRRAEAAELLDGDDA